MNPQEPTPSGMPPQQSQNQPPSLPSPPRITKRLIIIGAVVLIVVLVIIFRIMAMQKKATDDTGTTNKSPQTGQTVGDGPATFTVDYAKKAPTYANTTQYDACSLLSFGTTTSKVTGYPQITDSIKPIKAPLTIVHNYIDRDISQPLGNDGQPPSKSTTIGGDGKTTLDSFTSLRNGYCVYGQGKPSSNTFARIYVMQAPTPLSTDFLSFVAGLPKKQANGIDTYTVETPDKDGYLYAALVSSNKKTAVIFKTGIPELLTAGIDEISKKLAGAPIGPAQFTYPGAYGRLVNPCYLFTADDFGQFMKKPAQAMAKENLTLTPTQDAGIERECQRIEAEQASNDVYEFDTSNIVVRQLKDESAAKVYLNSLKASTTDRFVVTASQTKIGDESYIKVSEDTGAAKARSYVFMVRIKGAIIEIELGQTAAGDASAKAFEQRVLPAVKVIKDHYTALVR